MALTKVSSYAPDVFKALDGILLLCKPANLGVKEFRPFVKSNIVSQLNELDPRPLAKKLVITGGIDEEKRVTEVPNLADHPLVVGPRYAPWELKLSLVEPVVGYRSNGIQIALLGSANRFFFKKMKYASLINVYHLSGRFGYVTDNRFYDGRIHDKSTFKHINPTKMDHVLARIEATQHERLFDAANVPIQSQEAYELAKAWPSRPPRMAHWPVIYRLRCIHLRLPEFKLEVTVVNENENYLASLVHEVGLALKSGAYTDSIKRVKMGPFDIKDSLLIDKQLDLQSIVEHCNSHRPHYTRYHEFLRQARTAGAIRTEHGPEYLPSADMRETRHRSSYNG